MASPISVEMPEDKVSVWKVSENSGPNTVSVWGLSMAEVAISLYPMTPADTGLGFYSNDDKLHSK